jgi:hypothetical protein
MNSQTMTDLQNIDLTPAKTAILSYPDCRLFAIQRSPGLGATAVGSVKDLGEGLLAGEAEGAGPV